MKLDLDTMFAMAKYSDAELGAKFAKMYSEADDKSDKMQINHLTFVMQYALDPSRIKGIGNSTSKWFETVKMIDNTGGDIKKLKDYDKLVEAQNTAEVICEATKSMKYMNQVKNLHKIILDNSSAFTKGYKRKMEINNMIYTTLVMAWIRELSVISTATVAVQNVPNTNVDKYIEKTSGWKSLFERTSNLIEDKDFKRLLVSTSDITLKAEAIETYAEAIASYCTLYSEVTLQDVALLIKLGLAKTCYSLFGLIRFLIFSALYAKYTLEDRIATIKEVMAFNNTDLASRANEEEKFVAKLSEVRIDDIDTMTKADKEADNVQVKEDKESETGFSL